MNAKERKAIILAAALRLADKKGFASLRRDDIATEAGVSFALVTARLGPMNVVRRSVMREAIRLEKLNIVGQGLAMGDRNAKKAPDDLKDRAVQWIAANAR